MRDCLLRGSVDRCHTWLLDHVDSFRNAGYSDWIKKLSNIIAKQLLRQPFGGFCAE